MEGIKKARDVLGWSQEKLASELGTSQALVSKWEHAKTVKLDTLERVSDATGITLSFLLGISDDPFTEPTQGHVYYKPVLGRIAAGTAREAIERTDETHWVSETLYTAHPHGFWLEVSGNSMNRLFPDGALVYVDLDADVRDGDVAVVFVNGDDATVKRIYWEGDSQGPGFEPLTAHQTKQLLDGLKPSSSSRLRVGSFSGCSRDFAPTVRRCCYPYGNRCAILLVARGTGGFLERREGTEVPETEATP